MSFALCAYKCKGPVPMELLRSLRPTDTKKHCLPSSCFRSSCFQELWLFFLFHFLVSLIAGKKGYLEQAKTSSVFRSSRRFVCSLLGLCECLHGEQIELKGLSDGGTRVVVIAIGFLQNSG